MSLRIALLGLLAANGTASGYDLAKLFDVSLNHVWQAGHTQIYPELVRMAGDGILAVEAEGARGRKTYTITDEGSRELRDWLADHDPVVVIRSETALQAFLLPLLDQDEAIAAVERIGVRARERLDHLNCQKDADAEPGIGSHALRLGLAQAQTMIDWADDTLRRLRAG